MSTGSSQPISIQTHGISTYTVRRPFFRPGRRLISRLKGISPHYALRTILDGIKVSIPGGQLTAIMGGSGSGKTTLLNILAGRNCGGSLETSGHVDYSDQRTVTASRNAYVTQDDILPHNLTVRETLNYAAELRVDWESVDQRNAAVEKLLMQLSLTRCADSRIVKEGEGGCSGGEKRRVSVAIQLLTNCSILFCDEPTTGTQDSWLLIRAGG